MANVDEEKGSQLLHAVERITDSPEKIKARVDDWKLAGGGRGQVVEEIIRYYSNASAVSGAATTLPALIPGIGTLAYLATGPLADMVLLLKFEAEMCQALAYVHGYDIAKPEERQLAFLLAAVKTSEVSTGRFVLSDVGEASLTAMWNYAPRRVSKLLVEVLAIVAVSTITRKFFLAIPFIGMAVGAGMNKVLTGRVGKQANDELELRARLLAQAAPAPLPAVEAPAAPQA